MVELRGKYVITSNRESGLGRYEANLRAKGIPTERIRKYGFAFKGNMVLIG